MKIKKSIADGCAKILAAAKQFWRDYQNNSRHRHQSNHSRHNYKDDDFYRDDRHNRRRRENESW